MQRIKMLGIAILAVSMLGVLAGTASAAEVTKILASAFPVKFTGASKEAKLSTKGGTTVTCKTDTSSGADTSENAGTFSVLFENCTSSFGSVCTGLTATTSGDIISAGTFDFRLMTPTGGKLTAGFVFLPTETHFTCTTLGVEVLALVKGCVPGSAEPLEKLTKVITIKLAEKSTGVNAIVSYLPNEGTKETECILLTSKSGGTFEQSSEVVLQQVLGSTEVLLMN